MSAPTADKAPAPVTRIDYTFVTNIRFVSMVGIVALHAEVIPVRWEETPYNLLFDQLAKFATVSFFLVAGFLLGDRLDEVAPGAYMMRRLRTVAWPWAIWTFLYLLLGLAMDYAARGAGMRPLAYHLNNSVLASAYWFVPNLMLALATLLVFRRWLDRWWLGAAFYACSTAYSLNLHFRWWEDTRHTAAWFGFIAFLWTGYQLRRHYAAATAAIARAPWALLAASVVATFAASLVESRALAAARGADFDHMSTLRLTNVAYTFSVFALLFKVRRRIEPPGMDARRYTFGIYLLQTVVFAVVSRAYKLAGAKLAGVAPLDFNDRVLEYIPGPGLRLLAQVVVFATVYLTCWALVARLAKTRLAGILGVRDA